MHIHVNASVYPRVRRILNRRASRPGAQATAAAESESGFKGWQQLGAPNSGDETGLDLLTFWTYPDLVHIGASLLWLDPVELVFFMWFLLESPPKKERCQLGRPIFGKGSFKGEPIWL